MTKTNMNQIKNTDRVKTLAEVFTAPPEVNTMICLCYDEIAPLDNLVMEPSCGSGNFVIELLKTKLNNLQIVTSDAAVRAVSAIIGIDLMHDNVFETKQRILDYLNQFALPPYTIEKIKEIIDTNILVGNIMTVDLS